MPQMAPMLWFLIYLAPITIMILTMTMLNFDKNHYITLPSTGKLNASSKNWSW